VRPTANFDVLEKRNPPLFLPEIKLRIVQSVAFSVYGNTLYVLKKLITAYTLARFHIRTGPPFLHVFPERSRCLGKPPPERQNVLILALS
jgi:hypothetical protein